MPFTDANTSFGLPANDKFRVGISDIDPNQAIEEGVILDWASSSIASYLYYDCTVGIMLDSGMVIHNRLPQVDNLPDTLASTALDSLEMDTITDLGVNLTSRDQYQDIVQRMGHSRYWFRIWGMALRVGYKVPIPSIKMIAGVPTIPYDRNPQWGFNGICPGCNYGGVVLWRAKWSLWYTTAIPPINNTIPAADPSTLITGTPTLPDGIQVPISMADSNAERRAPRLIDDGIIGVTGR